MSIVNDILYEANYRDRVQPWYTFVCRYLDPATVPVLKFVDDMPTTNVHDYQKLLEEYIESLRAKAAP